MLYIDVNDDSDTDKKLVLSFRICEDHNNDNDDNSDYFT